METTTELTAAKKVELQADLATLGYVNCPCCGWNGLTVTKAGKIRKHGRAQTGRDGLGCRGGGMSIR